MAPENHDILLVNYDSVAYVTLMRIMHIVHS